MKMLSRAFVTHTVSPIAIACNGGGTSAAQQPHPFGGSAAPSASRAPCPLPAAPPACRSSIPALPAFPEGSCNANTPTRHTVSPIAIACYGGDTRRARIQGS